jgi:outer membrane protein assembly factor BamB
MDAPPKLVVAATIAVTICLLAAPVARADDWPQWRGPNRDGNSPETGLLKSWPSRGPKQVWKVTGVGQGFSSPSVAGGTVYVTGHAGNDLVIKALDLDGREKWPPVTHGPGWRTNHPGSRGSPTVDGRNVYVLSGKGLLVCYDAATGRRRWSVDITRAFGGKPGNWGYAESPLILGNAVIVTPGGSKCIVAIDKSSGRTVWTSKGLSDPANYSSCIAFKYRGASLVATLTSKGLVCVNAATGQFLWRNDRAAGRTAVCPTPVHSDGFVFAASGYGNGGVCQVLSVRGRQLAARQAWETKDMDCHHGGYVIVDGHVYGNHKGGWNCLDLKTGRKLWGSGGVGKGSIIYADGMLYTFSESGGRIALVEATPRGYSEKGRFSVQGSRSSWAHPVIAGGRLYLRYDDNLYAFDIKARR